MATTTEVNKALDEISISIDSCRRTFQIAKDNIQKCSDTLTAIPTSYSDPIGTIDGYPGGDTYENYRKAELAKLTTEFQTLLNEVNQALAAL